MIQDVLKFYLLSFTLLKAICYNWNELSHTIECSLSFFVNILLGMLWKVKVHSFLLNSENPAISLLANMFSYFCQFLPIRLLLNPFTFTPKVKKKFDFFQFYIPRPPLQQLQRFNPTGVPGAHLKMLNSHMRTGHFEKHPLLDLSFCCIPILINFLLHLHLSHHHYSQWVSIMEVRHCLL